MASDVADVSRVSDMGSRSINSYSDQGELRRLWQQPVRLFRLSNSLRQRSCGDEVSFVVNRNINFTNICTGTCRFCSFKHRRGYFLSTQEILNLAAEAESLGATEICLQGGLAPGMMLEDYCEMLEAIRRDHPRMHLHAFSPMEVMHMSRNSKVEIRDSLQELKRSGLGSLPGTAAEILVDRIRESICPDKLKAREWREIILTAHALGIPTTSTMLFGHVESLEDRLEHLRILKEIQSESGGFTETVLLPFIPQDSILGQSARGADLLEKLKMHALARVALYPDIINIQASWAKLGRDGAAAAIDWGANDLGGTLMDEKIARNSREAPRISADELIELIEAKGRRAVQRTTLYQKVSLPI